MVIFRSSFFFSAVSVRDLEKIMSRKVFSGAGKQSAFLDLTHSDMNKICCCPQSVQSSDHLARDSDNVGCCSKNCVKWYQVLCYWRPPAKA